MASAETARHPSARAVALDLLDAVLLRRQPLDEALDNHAAPAALSPRDKQFARALVATTLRQLGRIDHVLAQCLERPLPARAQRARNILRLGAAQLMFLETPAHAAVDAMVTLAAGAGEAGYKGLTNAVLRRIARDPAAFAAAAPAGAISLPDWLWQSWSRAYGTSGATEIAMAHLAEPPLDFALKRPEEAAFWAAQLHAVVLPGGFALRRPAADALGKRLHQRVRELPGFAEGAWWIQDVAAQLPARLLGAVAGRRVIDLCAAPGGKTAQLAAAGARVTALDRHSQRLARMRENLHRLKLDAALEVADAALWHGVGDFDAVLLDAPCSASGTIRRHPDVAWLKEGRDLGKLAAVQDRLLDAAAALLRPGGVLVYSVCSLQPEEGEARIAALLAREPRLARRPLRPAEALDLPELLSPAGDLRSLPSHLAAFGGMDGFYAARLVRQA